MDYKLLLNEQQFKAVSTTSQFTRVIAGAGSGKTRVLTYRIAYLISEFHVNPYNILAVAFTNKVANEMKERIKNILPEESQQLKIQTFHSFGVRFLKEEIEKIGFTRNFSIFDDEDSRTIVKNICVYKGYSKSDHIIKEARGYISYKKCKGITPDKIKPNNEHEKELLDIYEMYEENKNSMQALDFDDLLIKTNYILKTFSDVKEKWNRRLKYILIDEFQDTNDVQFEMLKLLSSIDTNIYVVGDPDQTIYSWRGANQNIIMDFDKYYKNAETIILNKNYRSTKTILDTANTLIKENKNRVKKDLYSDNINGDKVSVFSANSSENEARHVVQEIIRLKEKNLIEKLSEVTILYRASYLSKYFETELSKNRINYYVFGGLKFFNRKEIKDVLSYFRLIANSNDDVAFERIYNVPSRKVGETSFEIIVDESRKRNLSYFNFIKTVTHGETDLNFRALESLKILVDQIEKVRIKLNNNNEPYSKVLKDFLEEIRYFDYLSSNLVEDGEDRKNNVKVLFEDMESFIKTNKTDGFETWLSNCILATSQDEIKDGDGVSLMTIHTSKGLEFNYVFVVGLMDGVFPNQKSIDESIDGLEEERRLCYVAFTRAKKRLCVSYNSGYSYVSSSEGRRSRFIDEAKLLVPTPIKTHFSDFSSEFKIFKHEEFEENYSQVKEQEQYEEEVTNDIVWNVGDKLEHKTFGEGVVTKIVSSTIIEVDFAKYGKKQMLGNHKFLNRIYNVNAD